MTSLATYVTALDQTWTGLASACTDLRPEQWDLPTELPGWSVKDNVSHVVGLERNLLGEPQPDDYPLPDDLPHVRNRAGRYMEVAVHQRRAVPGDEVLAELREVTARRLAALRALPESALDEETVGFFGPLKTRHFLGIRVFDCWAHEQDVRRALGRPGGLDSDAARVSLRRLLLALTRLAEDVPRAAGRSLVIETTGPLPSVSTLLLGDDAKYVDGAEGDGDVRVTTDWETFVRLGTGRVAYDDVAGSVMVVGDVALGEELARSFAVTP